MTDDVIDKHYIGHRQRVRERFLNSKFESLPEYEIIELLLFLAIPRGDVKPLAKRLLREFGGLINLVNAAPEKLMEQDGVGPNVVATFRLFKESAKRLLKGDLKDKTILQSWSSLIDYLTISMGSLKTEQFRILYLDKKNCLISDELQEVGTVDQTPIYPREIVKRILFHEATAIILVHNHPTGNVNPSKADIVMTKKIIDVCNTINVIVHDHVIIGGGNFYSFKSNMLI